MSEPPPRLEDQPTTDSPPEPEARSIMVSLDAQGRFVPGISLRDLDAEEARLPEIHAGPEKYQILELLAEGGMGKVYVAHDRDLHRKVALKTLRSTDPVQARRFIEESQVLSQLEHPNIVALHELGLTANKRPYYTMPWVRGQPLSQLLNALVQRDPAMLRTWSIPRLVRVFLQVAQAIAYAHDRGVIHRDLKPANIMLGEHGEVRVLDWGLSKVVSKRGVKTDLGEPLTQVGHVVGTLGYMSPEQTEGGEVDERTDIFAMGAILYQMLTLTRPFAGKTLAAVAAEIREAPVPPRRRAPGRDIPPELERACLKALEPDPRQRFQRILDLHDAVEAWLEAEADRTKRRELADGRCEEGRARLERYLALKEEVARREQRAQELETSFRGWQPLEEKRSLLDAQAAVAEAHHELARASSETVATLTEAIGFDPRHAAARGLLADYYWDRFRDAEARGALDERNLFGELVRTYHDGKYDDALRGDGSFALTSEPEGAEAWLHELVESDLQLVPRNETLLGTTPIARMALPMGSYLVILRHPGFRDTRVPVAIRRGGTAETRVRLFTDAEIGAGFVHVPAGPFPQGGPDHVRGYTLPEREVHVDDFFMAEFPVTMGEYLEFLNDLAPSDLEGALARSPRQAPEGGYYLKTTDQGLLELPDIDAEGDRWLPDLPVLGISWNDIEEYCRWRSKRDGLRYRLPSEVEWEKAARGVDGRIYPWGNRFDPSLCNMRESLRDRTAPVVVSAYPTDVSIYGVRGMGGNVRDWTSTVVVEGEGESARVNQVVRGGGWFNPESDSRVASRYWFPRAFVYMFFGFRLARSAGP